jgi:hypothetical protein
VLISRKGGAKALADIAPHLKSMTKRFGAFVVYENHRAIRATRQVAHSLVSDILGKVCAYVSEGIKDYT